MMQVIYNQTFNIRTSEVDAHTFAHPHALIRLMQEASMQHTLINRISFQDLTGLQATWILLKMDVRFMKFPKLNDIVTVQTYPSGIQGFFTFRDYLMTDSNGGLIASIASMWALMHTETRKIIRIPEHLDAMVHTGNTVLGKPDFTPEFQDYPCEPVFKKVNYLHLDWNGHVNNVQLLKMLLACLDEAFVTQNKLIRLQVQYKYEALIGMELKLCNHLAENTIQHIITDTATGKIIVIAQSAWVNR